MQMFEINQKMVELAEKLEKIDKLWIAARLNWKKIKANYENEWAKTMLLEKAKDSKKTQSDLKAIADVETYEDNLKTIKAESKYKRLQLERERLLEEFEAVKELSYNARAELKKFGGN